MYTNVHLDTILRTQVLPTVDVAIYFRAFAIAKQKKHIFEFDNFIVKNP